MPGFNSFDGLISQFLKECFRFRPLATAGQVERSRRVMAKSSNEQSSANFFCNDD